MGKRHIIPCKGSVSLQHTHTQGSRWPSVHDEAGPKWVTSHRKKTIGGVRLIRNTIASTIERFRRIFSMYRDESFIKLAPHLQKITQHYISDCLVSAEGDLMLIRDECSVPGRAWAEFWAYLPAPMDRQLSC